MTKIYKVKKGHRGDQFFVVEMTGGPKDLESYVIEHVCYSLEKAKAMAEDLNGSYDEPVTVVKAKLSNYYNNGEIPVKGITDVLR